MTDRNPGPACDNAPVPSYAQPPVDPSLRRLVEGLGVNQVRLAVLAALARAGGTLSTSELVDQLAIPRMTALRNLKALESVGYVSSSEPPDLRRGGRRALWSLQRGNLHATLQAAVDKTTPCAGGESA